MAFSYKPYQDTDEYRKKKAELDALRAPESYSPSREVTQARDEMARLRRPAEYQESAAVADARTKLNEIKAPGAYSSAYADRINAIVGKIENRTPFTYDVNNDALYQQYKDQYVTGGRLAMQDAMGQAAAMTGGYGNSYADAVGNQAYQAYLGRLNDIVPELYNAAYDRYRAEGQDLYQQYGLYADLDQQGYARHRDDVADYNTERGYLTDLYNAERSVDYNRYRDALADYEAERGYLTDRYNAERSFDYNAYQDALSQYNAQQAYLADQANRQRAFDYGAYQDAYSNAFASYQQGVAEAQWDRQFAEDQRQFNANLSENQRQFNANLSENQRQFNAQMALRQIASSSGGSSGRSSGGSRTSGTEKSKTGDDKVVPGGKMTDGEIRAAAINYAANHRGAKINNEGIDYYISMGLKLSGEAKVQFNKYFIEAAKAGGWDAHNTRH